MSKYYPCKYTPLHRTENSTPMQLPQPQNHIKNDFFTIDVNHQRHDVENHIKSPNFRYKTTIITNVSIKPLVQFPLLMKFEFCDEKHPR